MAGPASSGRAAPRASPASTPIDGQDADLHQIGGKDRAAFGPHRLERGDAFDLAVQIGPDRRGDADAADGEARQPDQHEERPHPFDEPLHPRRAVAAVAPAQALIAEARLGCRFQRGKVGPGRQGQAVAGVIERAGFQQAGSGQIGGAHDAAGPEAEAAGGGVGFAEQARAVGEGGEAETEGVAGLQPHAVGQNAVEHRAAVGERLVERQRQVKTDGADQRIGVIDRLDLRQRADGTLALPRDGHRAEVVDLGDAGGDAFQIGALIRRGGAVGEGRLRVAAEQDRPLFVQPGADANRGRCRRRRWRRRRGSGTAERR